MAIDAAYATAAEYRASMDKQDTGSDAAIDDDLLSISRHLERRIGRFFNKDATEQSRIFVPSGGRNETDILAVDDLVSVSEIVIDDGQDDSFGTTVAASDYELLPRNADKGPEPQPYRQIRLAPWSDSKTSWPNARVKVTGIWGWPAVPKPIKTATIRLTGILRLEHPAATGHINEMGEPETMGPEAQHIVANLIRNYKLVEF